MKQARNIFPKEEEVTDYPDTLKYRVADINFRTRALVLVGIRTGFEANIVEQRSLTCCEVAWLVEFVKILAFTNLQPVGFVCANQEALVNIAGKLEFLVSIHSPLEGECERVSNLNCYTVVTEKFSRKRFGQSKGVETGLHANIKANGISYNLGWIIDSGANQHITSSTNNMTNVIDILELNITVGHPNGTTAKIRKVGNLKLTNNIVLFDVLVIPEYCVSLLSVNKLIGEEDLSGGNVFENFDVPTNLFNPKESNTEDNNTLRRSSRQSKLPPKLNDYVLDSKAMNDEIEALYENNSWDLVDLPKNRKAIGSKWVYKIKHKSIGEIDRYKARCLISLAVQNGWCLFQLDVNNAFLYGNLDEDTPRQWNNRLSEALVENDFKQSGHDHSLYTKESGGSFVSLLVYVDDIVLTGNNINEINKVKTFLKSKFKIKDLGEL
ncbi:ribonuclease H-like domain-containing protein [Tanacetum coccineum]